MCNFTRWHSTRVGVYNASVKNSINVNWKAFPNHPFWYLLKHLFRSGNIYKGWFCLYFRHLLQNLVIVVVWNWLSTFGINGLLVLPFCGSCLGSKSAFFGFHVRNEVVLIFWNTLASSSISKQVFAWKLAFLLASVCPKLIENKFRKKLFNFLRA